MRKPEIITAIETCAAFADEISECWGGVKKGCSKRTLNHCSAFFWGGVAREKLEVEMLQRKWNPGEVIVKEDNSSTKMDMRYILQPFRVEGDIGLSY